MKMMTEANQVKKAKLFLILNSFLVFQGFIGPIIFLFYTRYMGLSTEQYYITDSILFICMAIFEIPSGYIADRYGRKKILVISKSAIIIAMIMLVIRPNFSTAIIVAILYGFFGAMESGIVGASIYEIFQKSNKGSELEKIYAKVQSINFGMCIVYSLLSGVFMEINLALPVIVDIIVCSISLLLCLFLLDNPVNYRPKNTKFVIEKKAIINFIPIMMISSCFFCFSRVAFSFYQPILKSIKFTPYLLGIMASVYSIINAISSFYYSRFKEILKSKKAIYLLFILIQIVTSIGMILKPSYAILIAILLQQIMRGLMGPFLYMETNKYVDPESKARVTLVSINNFVTTGLTAIMLFITSLVTKFYDFKVSILVVTIILNLILIFSFINFMNKLKRGTIKCYEKKG